MADYGRVVGGHYLDSIVSPSAGSELVVRTGFKGRKLNEEQVASWEEIFSEPKSNRVSAVGQAVAGAVLPRFIGKAASAAVGATFDTMRPPRIVRIHWVDEKLSLIKLPEKLFTHLALMLQNRQAAPVELPSAAVELIAAPVPPPTLAEQALTQLSGLLRDKIPGRSAHTSEPLETTLIAQPDVTEQLTKLSALRDAGIVTEDEFLAKKTELLARL